MQGHKLMKGHTVMQGHTSMHGHTSMQRHTLVYHNLVACLARQSHISILPPEPQAACTVSVWHLCNDHDNQAWTTKSSALNGCNIDINRLTQLPTRLSTNQANRCPIDSSTYTECRKGHVWRKRSLRRPVLSPCRNGWWHSSNAGSKQE